MYLTKEEERMLEGEEGHAVQKSMEILVALSKIYKAERLVKVRSVQVAGVSYRNLGDAGLEYLNELAKDGRVRVTTTLNPAGMDLEAWKKMGISEEFARKQEAVINAFRKMGIEISCTCTPFLVGNLPLYGEHVAWSESSAVTYVNSVIGAKTNREGGPSALAAALTGRTPLYGLHLEEERKPDVHVKVKTKLKYSSDWGALGYCVGKRVQNMIPYITGVEYASLENLKALAASIVTYGSKPLFHIKGITPESEKYEKPKERIEIEEKDIRNAYKQMSDEIETPDFISLGCPHSSIEEIAEIAKLLERRRIKRGIKFWVVTARSTKKRSDELGYTQTIENAGGKIFCDTCMVVAPLRGKFKSMLTNSAKACYYCRSWMRVKLASLKNCVEAAVE